MNCSMIYNVFYMLRTVRRAAEGEPPRLEAGSRYMENINPGCCHGESLSGFSTMRHIPQRMLRRQASTKVNLTRWQSGPRPGTRCPVRRHVNFVEGRSSFSVPRPLPTTLKTEERQVPRAAGAQSAGLLHIGFILKHLFVDRSRLRVLTALQ